MNRPLLLLGGGLLAALLAIPMPARSQGSAAISTHERAARELYRLVGGVKAAEAGADAMMGLVRDNPELAPYEDVFRAWYHKVFAEGDFEGEMARIYVNAFTEEELQGIAAFYRTPLGQKALQKLPETMKQGAEVGMRRAKEHSAELLEMLAKAKKEREAQKKPGP